MTTHQQTVVQFSKMLNNMSVFIDKATAYATTKKFEPDTFVDLRLAPDMYSFAKQIQIATDNAKGGVARLAGQEPPKFEDNEKTLGELKTRLKKTVDYISKFKPDDFKGAEDRRITLPWAPGKYMQGGEYLVEMLVPNFYFHVMAAYAILRHNGVDLGKPDFIGNINFR